MEAETLKLFFRKSFSRASNRFHSCIKERKRENVTFFFFRFAANRKCLISGAKKSKATQESCNQLMFSFFEAGVAGLNIPSELDSSQRPRLARVSGARGHLKEKKHSNYGGKAIKRVNGNTRPTTTGRKENNSAEKAKLFRITRRPFFTRTSNKISLGGVLHHVC